MFGKGGNGNGDGGQGPGDEQAQQPSGPVTLPPLRVFVVDYINPKTGDVDTATVQAHDWNETERGTLVFYELVPSEFTRSGLMSHVARTFPENEGWREEYVRPSTIIH